jgi:hypothetical protein
VSDDDLERLLPPSRPRGFVALVVGSVVSGVAAFVVAIVMSELLVPAEGQSLEIGAPVMVCIVAFVVLLAACIVLGYVAARRRPPPDA